ncbi:barstar family protein [Rhizobium sp.]|uniref:barstar family protein n=1 Tax=Rhizobium sp. TaxID=391 RepID=UPI002EDBED4E
MTELIVDCSGVASVEDFWDRYVSSIGAENATFFGRNLDALWDALEGDGPGSPPATHLIFKNIGELKALETRSGNSFLKALSVIADKVSRVRVEMI